MSKKYPNKSTNNWGKYEQKLHVNSKICSDFERFNKPLHPLDPNNSIEKHLKKNEKSFHLKSNANGYYINSDIPGVLKKVS